MSVDRSRPKYNASHSLRIRTPAARDCSPRSYLNVPVVSMKSLAEEYRVSWRTVRDAIEDGLRKRYRRRDYSKMTNIVIDELNVFRNERPSRKCITTVRDLDSKVVLDVA